MNKEQLLEGMKRAIVVFGIEDGNHLSGLFHNVVAFSLGRIDATTPLEFDTHIGEHLAEMFDEGLTYEHLYEQLTEENNAE